jgi:hypothetical protein
MTGDRTVHVTINLAGDQIEIVRYDRAGKWWLERATGYRRRLSLADAVAYAKESSNVIWHEGAPGGRMFDAWVRQMRGRAS